MQTNRKTQITRNQIFPIAEKMREQGVMLIMIHGWQGDDGTPAITYDYLLEGTGQILVTPLKERRKANVNARADGKQ